MCGGKFIYHTILVSLIATSWIVAINAQSYKIEKDVATNSTQTECSIKLVETMPINMNFDNPVDFKLESTFDALMDIISKTKNNLKIASFYWHLTPDSKFANDSSTKPGTKLMDAIEEAATKRGVKVEIVIDGRDMSMSQAKDIERLKSFSYFKILNVSDILGSGVMHSKFMIGDDKYAYIGSSNFDWRSYTHIKEIGVKLDNCETLSGDMRKIFRIYQAVADSHSVPKTFSETVKTDINIDHPMIIDNVLGSQASVYLSAAPPEFNRNLQFDSSTNRTDDIDAIVNAIDNARTFVYISVLNYSPETQYQKTKEYWPAIDLALRAAATKRDVKVKLLFSDWSNKDQKVWYRSLNAVKFPWRKSGIWAKEFKVPKTTQFEQEIPFARVKHDKFLVTDDILYVGTSNWTPDYFITTCGVGFSARFDHSETDNTKEHELIRQAKLTFERDFESQFASNYY